MGAKWDAANPIYQPSRGDWHEMMETLGDEPHCCGYAMVPYLGDVVTGEVDEYQCRKCGRLR